MSGLLSDIYPIIENRIDWGLVADSTLPPFQLLHDECEDLLAMAITATEKYLSADIQKYELVNSEQKFNRRIYHGGDPEGFQFNLYGTPDLEFLERATGFGTIVDWKTTGSITPDLCTNYERSWQWKTYLFATYADYFIYRVVERPPQDGSKIKVRCKEISLYRYVDMNDAVLKQYGGVALAMQALRNDPELTVWPMKKPFACGSYGRKCPYYDGCPGESAQLLPSTSLISLNNSGADSFMLCNERYRRNQIHGENAEGNRTTHFGQAFHAVMSEIYRQGFSKIV